MNQYNVILYTYRYGTPTSALLRGGRRRRAFHACGGATRHRPTAAVVADPAARARTRHLAVQASAAWRRADRCRSRIRAGCAARSEEHTSELQSLMRISYAVFCLK